MPTYAPAQAARLASVSPASVRNYCKRFSRWFSADATPPAGQARSFTADDVRLLRYVGMATSAGATLAEVDARLDDGALDDFTWSPPDPDAPAPPAADPGAALAPIAAALIGQLEHMRQREAQLTDALLDAQRRIGQLESQLEARRPWWSRLLRG